MIQRMVKARKSDKEQNSIFYNVEDSDTKNDEEEGPEVQSKKRSLSMESDDDIEESMECDETDTCEREARRVHAVQKIADFLVDFSYMGGPTGVDLNVVKLDSFKEMTESVGEYGPNLIPPSELELRELLTKKVMCTNELLQDMKRVNEKSGCSILFDGWTDEEGRTLINILVNNTTGTMFLKSVDASSYIKSGKKLFKLLDKYVDHVGEKNVVQVITRTDNICARAGKLLQSKRPHLFWTPCAANRIESMLEDICEIPIIKKTISKGIALVGFIYNHAGVLKMTRFFTGNKELAKQGVTRFTTTFLTLQSLQKRQPDLRRMFASQQWSESSWSKHAKGNKAKDIVFMPTFWNNVAYILRAMCPLVMVLRVANNEKNPSAMCFIYEIMNRSKETLLEYFDNEDSYKKVLEFIDEKWKDLLNHPLYLAGYYLNPYVYYHNPKINEDAKFLGALFECLDRMIESQELKDKIIVELVKFRNSEEVFGHTFAIEARNVTDEEQRMRPVDWWNTFGVSALNLKNFAVRILGLAYSASSCENKRSIFAHMHSMKWNMLEYKRLQDVVYVSYNKILKSNANDEKKIKRDPLRLTNISGFDSEWLLEEEMDSGDNEYVTPNFRGENRGNEDSEDGDVDVFVDDDEEEDHTDIDEIVVVEPGVGAELQEFSD